MKKVCTVILCLACLICAIGFAACANVQPYYGTYHALNEDDEIIIDDKGFTFGGTAYNYEDKGAYFLLTNYSGNTTKWYRYENDNVISPRVTFNFSTGNIPTRNGFFDATLTALDNRLNPTSVFYFTSYGEYQLVFPNAPALSEKGTYWLEGGLLKLNGRYQLSNSQTVKYYYIDKNFAIHVYAYVKDLSLFKRTTDDATYTPTTPTDPNEPTTPSEQTTPTDPNEPTTPSEPTTPTEPVETYELKYKFNSALEGYVVSGYEGTINNNLEIPFTYKNVPVVGIANAAFSSCSSLTSITIPDSVTIIGQSAFSYCSSLTNITIPNSVTSIGISAFSDCSSLTSITIPNSVTSIESYAFSGCSSLTSITIPDSVTSIESYVFSGCSSLTSITIPVSVTRIGSYAFSGCSSLTSVTIGNGVTHIGDYVFRNCKNLKAVYIDSSYAVNYANFADTLPEHANNIYIRTSIEPTLSVYTIVYEKQDGTVINDGKEYYHYKVKE